MYDIKWIRENAEIFDRGLERRRLKPEAARLFELDDKRRAAIATSQAAQERRNARSKETRAAMKAEEAGDTAHVEGLVAAGASLKVKLAEYEAEEREATQALKKGLAEIPNTLLDDVPDGRDENDNVELRRVGEPRTMDFQPKEHFDIGEALGLMDFETAAKISGARFVVNKGPLARLERALAQFMLDLHTDEHSYTEVNPPILVRDEAMFGTAQLPKFREDQFLATRVATEDDWLRLKSEEDESFSNTLMTELASLMSAGAPVERMREAVNTKYDERLSRMVNHFSEQEWSQKFWLIPTAEVPLTNLVREKILDEKELPL